MAEEEKPKPGRPLKFQSAPELEQKINEYFGQCDPHLTTIQVKVQKQDGTHFWKEVEEFSEQQPYTIEGLARALDTNRKTLLNYGDEEHQFASMDAETKQQFVHTITRAKQRIAEFAERMLYTPFGHGAAFNLKNNYGWKDKTETDVTSGDKPLPLLGAMSVPGNNGTA